MQKRNVVIKIPLRAADERKRNYERSLIVILFRDEWSVLSV
jgi:hypothetical protein